MKVATYADWNLFHIKITLTRYFTSYIERNTKKVWQTIVLFQFLHQKGKLSKLIDYLQNICPDLEVFVINLWKCLFMYIPLIFDSLKVTLAWTVIVYLLWAHLFHCNDLKKTYIFRQSRKNDLVLKLKALLKPTLILVLR